MAGALLVVLSCLCTVSLPAMAENGPDPAPRLALVAPAGVTVSPSVLDDLRGMLRSANAWLQRESGRRIRFRGDATGAPRIETLTLRMVVVMSPIRTATSCTVAVAAGSHAWTSIATITSVMGGPTVPTWPTAC